MGERGGEGTSDGAEDEEEGGTAIVVPVATSDGEDDGEHGGISAGEDGGVACMVYGRYEGTSVENAEEEEGEEVGGDARVVEEGVDGASEGGSELGCVAVATGA